VARCFARSAARTLITILPGPLTARHGKVIYKVRQPGREGRSPLQAEGASSMVAHSALSFTSCIRSSTRLAHSKKAAGRSEEVPTLSTQRAKLVSPCSKLVRIHRLTFGEEVTNELD
jgi:hypothetical protein